MDVHLLSEQRVSGGITLEGRAPSPRSLALLAYLVLRTGAPQTRQHLAAVFWPDSSESQARTNLRRELHHLRALLDDDPSLVVDSAALTWEDRPTCRVDVRVFEHEWQESRRSRTDGDTAAFLGHAEAAIAEYRGELMPGSYDDWVLDERGALLRKCVDLCDGVVRLRAESGDPERAIEVAHRRVQLAPLEEAGYRALMTLQAEAGDRAAAVSTYHRCADLLERELDVTPDPETTELVERLLDRRGRPPDRAGPAPHADGRAAATVTGLVGRGPELAFVEERWRAAVAGTSGLVVVAGAPGVGKSRLVAELAARAGAEGAVVAATRCFGQSGRLALAPVADWLRSPDLAPGVAALDPVWRAEVTRLVPAPSVAASGRVDDHEDRLDSWQRHRFFEGLARAVLSADRPTLLVLDDLQWCDQETVAWLDFTLGLARDARLLIAATVRTDELEENRETATTLRGLRSAGLVSQIELAPLAPADTGRLAAALLGRGLAGDEEELLQAATGGYPFYVVEATRNLPDAAAPATLLPDVDVRAVLRHRLAQASPAAYEVAGLAAAVGRDFSLDLLARAADTDPGTLVQAVDELWRLRILRDREEGYDFSHDLLREAAYAEVSPPRRWLLHRRIAESLEEIHAGRPDDVAAQVAEQYERAGQADRALVHYRRAAAVASSLFANAEAARLLQRCLALVEGLPAGPERDVQELEVLEAMAPPLTALHGYSSPLLQSALERTAALADGLGQTSTVVESLVALFGVYFVQGHVAKSHEIACRTQALAGDNPELAAESHFAYAGSVLSLGRPTEALSHFDLVLELAPEKVSLLVGTRVDVHSQGWAAHADWLVGNDVEAATRRSDALARARETGHPFSLTVGLAYAAITDQLRGDREAVSATAAELRRLCEHRDVAYYGEWGLVLEGWAEGGEGGLEQIRKGIGRLRSLAAYARMPYWLSLLAVTLDGRGRRREAMAVLDAAVVTAEQRTDRWWLPEVLRLRATLSPDPEATRFLERALDLAESQGSRALVARCRDDLAARDRSPVPDDDTGTPNAVGTAPS